MSWPTPDPVQVIKIAARSPYHVHRYLWRAARERRMARRLLKAGWLLRDRAAESDKRKRAYRATDKALAWLESGDPFRYAWPDVTVRWSRSTPFGPLLVDLNGYRYEVVDTESGYRAEAILAEGRAVHLRDKRGLYRWDGTRVEEVRCG